MVTINPTESLTDASQILRGVLDLFNGFLDLGSYELLEIARNAMLGQKADDG